MSNLPINILMKRTLPKLCHVVDEQKYIILQAPLEDVYGEEIVGSIQEVQVHQNTDTQDSEDIQHIEDSLEYQDLEDFPEEYLCDSCDETFDTKAALVVHQTEQSIRKTRAALREAKSNKNSFNQWFLEQKSTIEKRKAYKPNIKLDFLNDDKVEDAVERDSSIESSNDHQEESECEDGTSGPKKIVRRSRKKEEDSGPIECKICFKTFKKRKYLNVHEGVHNSSYVCHICGTRAVSSYYLKMHIKRHNKEFSFYCSVCQKGFYLKANLKIHMSVHSEDKPCICQVCHKSFGNSVYLRNHMKQHEDPSSRKKYKCELCSFETFYSYCVKEHMLIHTGEGQVSCEVCGKMVRKQYMKTHIRIHTGEKPEMCEFCGKAFSAKKYLIKHRRTHTGEKPYQCTICEKRFTQRGTLTAHLRRHEISK